MKRTVTANISGIVFHIEEDAYEMLDRYLQKIRERIDEEESLQEIMEDIEARIAELFKEATSDSKEVVTERDVEEVIETLGRPEDFSEKEEEGAEGEDSTEKERSRNGKRIFRDPDDKVLGGVCSGISAYFGWDPLWLRLAFVIAVLLFGSGPLIYIVLWIIIPEARTRAEKLRMRGEPVDVDNLKRKVKEETDDLKERFGKFSSKEGQESFKGKTREILEQTGAVLKSIFQTIGVLLQKLAGLLLLVLGIAFAITLLQAFLGSGEELAFVHTPDASYSFQGFLETFLEDPLRIVLAKIGFGLFMGVPMLLFFYLGTKALFEFEGTLRGYGPVLFVLWMIGVILCAYGGAHYLGSLPG